MTASISGNGKTASAARRVSPMAALADRWIPKLVLAPSVVISLVFVYGFIAITGYLSLSNSRLMPRYEFAGLDRYRELFDNDVCGRRLPISAGSAFRSSASASASACSSRSCSTSRSATKARCAPCIFTRWRCRSS